jgi:hypothetical protein
MPHGGSWNRGPWMLADSGASDTPSKRSRWHCGRDGHYWWHVAHPHPAVRRSEIKTLLVGAALLALTVPAAHAQSGPQLGRGGRRRGGRPRPAGHRRRPGLRLGARLHRRHLGRFTATIIGAIGPGSDAASSWTTTGGTASRHGAPTRPTPATTTRRCTRGAIARTTRAGRRRQAGGRRRPVRLGGGRASWLRRGGPRAWCRGQVGRPAHGPAARRTPAAESHASTGPPRPRTVPSTASCPPGR